MNKKLIALAIASAVSAPAMAATSNVDVYGLMSVGVDSVENGYTDATGTHTNRAGRVSDYASRIGFKGSEDLGNGLSAIWQIENQLSVAGQNTNGTLNSGAWSTNMRNTFVGLKSKDMGTVLVGTHDTPYKLSTGRLDPFGDTMGDYNGLVGAAGSSSAALTNSGNYFDVRASQVLAYITPNWGGFTGAAAYVFGASKATNQADKTANAYSLTGMYDAGPLYLTAAYEKHNVGNATVGSLGFAVPNGSERSAYKVGAGYTIMDFTLGALYEKTKDNLGAAGANALGHSTWYLSGKYQMGAIALKAAYGKANSLAGLSDSGSKQYTVGADYGFSKRTTVYALYTKINNDTNANYDFALNPTTGAAGGAIGGDPSGFSLGVKHAF
jgi:predicted porin